MFMCASIDPNLHMKNPIRLVIILWAFLALLLIIWILFTSEDMRFLGIMAYMLSLWISSLSIYYLYWHYVLEAVHGNKELYERYIKKSESLMKYHLWRYELIGAVYEDAELSKKRIKNHGLFRVLRPWHGKRSYLLDEYYPLLIALSDVIFIDEKIKDERIIALFKNMRVLFFIQILIFASMPPFILISLVI